jgi:hypothetical protein
VGCLARGSRHNGGEYEVLPRLVEPALFSLDPDSYPALSTRGPGLVELFIVAKQQSFPGNPGDGEINLAHTWSDRIDDSSVVWSEDWESLGTGWLKGSPAAISWGPGRTDVFVVGWWRLALPQVVRGRPMVGLACLGRRPVHLVADGGLHGPRAPRPLHRRSRATPVAYLGEQQRLTSPAATSQGPGNVELFVYSGIGQFVQRSYNNGSWSVRVSLTGGTHASTVYWTPFYGF